MKRFDPLFSLIVFIAVVIRLFFLGSIPLMNSDGVLYAWIGSNLADGYGYTIAEGISLGDARAWHVPGYPAVLALFYKFLGKGLMVSKLPAFIFGVMTLVLIYHICVRLFDRAVALLASLMLAVHPQFIFFSAEVMAESMYVFFLLLFVYMLLAVKKESYQLTPYLIIGIIAGLCYLTRTVGILTIPFFIFYHLYRHRYDRLNQFVAFFGGFLMMAAPWWLWSKVKYGTVFSAEQNTLIQMYEFEFGHFTGHNLNLFSYILGKHELTAIFSGLLDGAYKILHATFIPRILYLRDIEYMNSVAVLLLILIVYALSYGAWNLRENKKPVLVVFIAVVIGNIIAYAWGAHLIPPDSSTIFRYTLPSIPFLLIILSAGIKRLFEEDGYHRVISIMCLVMIVFSASVVTQSNYRFNREWSYSVYERPLDGLSRNSSIFASNAGRVKSLGFHEVYQLGARNFSQIMDTAEEKKIKYIVVDTSSIYNDHQFYLVNHWYRERIPISIQNISSDTFPVTVYEIALGRQRR